MKTISLAIAAILISATGMAQSFNVDATASKVKWEAGKVTGDHWGQVSIKQGNLQFEGGKLVSGNFTMDMNTITVDDLQGEWGDKLKGHLESPDFFSVAKNPTANMKITKAKALGNDQYEVKADLTIKGITKPVVFKANVSNNGKVLNASSDITIDRTDYDIRYGSGSFFDGLGDKMIYDEFKLKVRLNGKVKA